MPRGKRRRTADDDSEQVADNTTTIVTPTKDVARPRTESRALLPKELLVRVFSHFNSTAALLRASQVSRAWLQAASEPALWATVNLTGRDAALRLSDAAFGRVLTLASQRAGAVRALRLQGLALLSFTTGIKPVLSQLASLHTLEIIDCQTLTYEGNWELVRTPTALQHLSLERSCVSDNTLRSLAESPSVSTLRTLCLRACTLITDASLIAVVEKCLALEELDISWCSELGESAIDAVTQHLGARLQRLDMRWCHKVPSTAVFKIAGRCVSLRVLNLSSVARAVKPELMLNDHVISALTSLKRLESLDITGLKDVTPAVVKKLHKHLPRLVNVAHKPIDAKQRESALAALKKQMEEAARAADADMDDAD